MSNRVKLAATKTRRRNSLPLAQCPDLVAHLPHGWWPPGIFAALSRCPGVPAMTRPTTCFDQPCAAKPTKWVISDSNGLRIQMAICDEHAAPYIAKATKPCDGSCHQAGRDDCELCGSSHLELGCEDCRFYAAQNP